MSGLIKLARHHLEGAMKIVDDPESRIGDEERAELRLLVMYSASRLRELEREQILKQGEEQCQ